MKRSSEASGGKASMARKFCGAALALTVLCAGAASGQEVYRGKVLHFIVGYSPGGSFDQYTRLIARHIGKHIPGSPSTVVENMPGAGGIIAANHLYNRAKPDGLTVGAWAAPLVLQHVLGNDAIKFDGRKFGYLGVPSPYDTGCYFNRESNIKTMEEWLAAKRPVKISSIGPGTSTSDVPKLLRAALRLPMEIVEGYKGGAEARLAVVSGEVDAFCGSWQATKMVWRSEMESGKIRLVVQVALKVHPELMHVPLAIQYAKDEQARLLLRIADHAHGYQFPYSVPPGTPPERLQILQKAFMEALRDRELLAEARKADLEVDPVDGPTVAKIFAGLYELEAGTVAQLRQLLVHKR
jgi:tripartite-type tricarboxylate transporter receptor subunit TctC